MISSRSVSINVGIYKETVSVEPRNRFNSLVDDSEMNLVVSFASEPLSVVDVDVKTVANVDGAIVPDLEVDDTLIEVIMLDVDFSEGAVCKDDNVLFSATLDDAIKELEELVCSAIDEEELVIVEIAGLVVKESNSLDAVTFEMEEIEIDSIEEGEDGNKTDSFEVMTEELVHIVVLASVETFLCLLFPFSIPLFKDSRDADVVVIVASVVDC